MEKIAKPSRLGKHRYIGFDGKKSRLRDLGLTPAETSILTDLPIEVICEIEDYIHNFLKFNAEGKLLLKLNSNYLETTIIKFLADLVDYHTKNKLSPKHLITIIGMLANLHIQYKKLEKEQQDTNFTIQINFDGIRPETKKIEITTPIEDKLANTYKKINL